MPTLAIQDLRVHYALSGSSTSPVLVLSNSLGADFSMWEAQMPALETKFRVLRYDTRGHGATSVTPGPYTIAQLARDVISLLDALKIESAHFCGLSMGGMVGMWLGVNAPARLRKLVLCSTSPRIGTLDTWNTRIELIRSTGMKAVALSVVERWLSSEFRERSPSVFAVTLKMLERAPAEGYVACCAAVRDFDATESVSGIRVPALVVGGTYDPATPPADVRAQAGRIAGARFVELPGSHLVNVEAPQEFNVELVQFLSS